MLKIKKTLIVLYLTIYKAGAFLKRSHNKPNGNRNLKISKALL